ncbi:hypothetical protein E3O44_15410 [Cryobacterium algoricola]|uniref:AbiV family abortive infection protein n=1 Tax=Cryobacterium algoricola TaxID=1259183 RepID=A0ABY2I946_9MICO|nr:hypothetical protein [Cryobacterium algoricola]TFB84467.1 hypothetical protein E3O44_15410 [Cryobacterium algoricola]
MYIEDQGEPSLPALHGISDRESGIEKAAAARVRLIRFAADAFPTPIDFDVPMMTLMSLLTRAQSFHDGALDAVRAGNPFAAFTLIRSYAENAAVLVRLKDRPDDLARLYPEAPRATRLRIGQITNGASARFGEFKGVYDQLSEFAHPSPATALSGWHASELDDGKVEWRSSPAFKSTDDLMMACVWLVELAEANSELWRECFEMYFGERRTCTPPEWNSGP